MAIIRKNHVTETIVNIGKNVDPQACKKLKGKLTEDDNCIVKILERDNEPERAGLELVNYEPDPKQIKHRED